jgi:hypothetical protein
VRFVHADAHFRIGTRHEADGSPCQDFALADNDALLPFALLSDGCSTSGRTDVGARVLTLTARRMLHAAPETVMSPGGFLNGLLSLLPAAGNCLGLSTHDLDATLGMVRATPGGGAQGMLFGDGAIAARAPTGVAVSVVEWAGNLPGYPSYFLDPTRYENFVTASTEAARVEGRAPFTHRRYLIGKDLAVTEIDIEERGAEAGLRGVSLSWCEAENAPDVIAAMSDGVFQFPGLGWETIATALTEITAARAGAFATRRMRRALDLFAKQGARPADDVALAAIAADAGR